MIFVGGHRSNFRFSTLSSTQNWPTKWSKFQISLSQGFEEILNLRFLKNNLISITVSFGRLRQLKLRIIVLHVFGPAKSPRLKPGHYENILQNVIFTLNSSLTRFLRSFQSSLLRWLSCSHCQITHSKHIDIIREI